MREREIDREKERERERGHSPFLFSVVVLTRACLGFCYPMFAAGVDPLRVVHLKWVP